MKRCWRGCRHCSCCSILRPTTTQSSPSDPPQRGQRILEAVKRLLFRESEVRPLLLVLEDLHSIDQETMALIDGLVDGLPGARIMLLVSFRPEFHHSWTSKSYFAQIRVDPLLHDIASELLDALIGLDEALGQIKEFLIEKTGGTPLFLEESVRSLVETGVLNGKHADYHSTTLIVELKIPQTIEALLTSRVDRLSLVDKRLLQAAAVIGYEVPLSILQAVANLRPDRLREALKRLQDAEFLYETNLFPDIEYRFKHALVHDAAYRMLSSDRRRTLHTATLIAGEQVYADRLIEKSDWLAFHAVRAQAWDRAVVHLQVAAMREVARAANRIAVQHLEGALIAVEHLPPDERATLAIDLRIDLRHALTPLGRVQETLDCLNAAEQIAAELEDSARLGRISFLYRQLSCPEGSLRGGAGDGRAGLEPRRGQRAAAARDEDVHGARQTGPRRIPCGHRNRSKGFWPCSTASRRTTFTASPFCPRHLPEATLRSVSPSSANSKRRRPVLPRRRAGRTRSNSRIRSYGPTGASDRSPSTRETAQPPSWFSTACSTSVQPMTWTPMPRGSWPALAGRWPGSGRSGRGLHCWRRPSRSTRFPNPRSRDRSRSPPMSKRWCWPANSKRR